MHIRAHLLLAFLMISLSLALLACNVQEDSSATPTPVRSVARAAVYITDPAAPLHLNLGELSLLSPPAEPDTQLFIALANGDGRPAYLLFPSNQPGVPETLITLSDYPLHLASNPGPARLWVLALRHTAYPVAEAVGPETLAAHLALGFDGLQSDLGPAPLAKIVAAQPDLLPWFGQVEVIGQLLLALDMEGQNQAVSADERLSLTYTLSLTLASPTLTDPPPPSPSEAASPSSSPSPSPSPSFAPTIAFASRMGQAIPGYRLILRESFDNASSQVRWFIGSDPTYSASFINGAYQIALTGIDPNRDVGLSWGSIQNISFDDYVVRARMRILEPEVLARYGLWLHYQDDFNFVFFGVENTGRYRVARFQRTYTELVPWAESNSIALGADVNELEIRIEGPNYSFMVNGQALAVASDTAFEDGRLTFFCYSQTVPATCHLEDLEIWIPEASPNPLATPAPPQ
jgi:hypothetical protein